MNQERFKKFAYQLFSIDSPSGFTKHAIDFLEKEANDLGFKTSRNQKGNLLAKTMIIGLGLVLTPIL